MTSSRRHVGCVGHLLSQFVLCEASRWAWLCLAPFHPPPPTNIDVPSWWVQRWPVYHPEFVVAEAVVVVVQQDGAMFSVLEFPKDAVYDADTVAAAVSKDAGVQVGASAGRVWCTGWV